MAATSLHSRLQPGSLGSLTIAALLIVCSGFTIGLTFARCYSSICVERWFHSQTRTHIAVFYGGIGIAVVYLAAWSRSTVIRSLSDRYLFTKQLPLIGIRLSLGGTLLSAWVLAFTLATTAFWLPAEHAFWHGKGFKADWTQYMFRVTWSGVTGHWCDILFGLVFLPVGRNSLISNAFGIQSSTLLIAHKLLAYTLCAFGLIHGLLYYSFLAAIVANPSNERVHDGFNQDNPFYTSKQAEQIGPYAWFPLPTGAAAGILFIPAMVITALPIIPRNNYNTFYYIHVIFALLVLVLLCLHASTNFYFVLPGLLLWVYDWSYRVQHALHFKQTIEVESAGNNWYRIRLPRSPRTVAGDGSVAEKGLTSQNASEPNHPLETYCVRLSAISRVQIHPFTAAATATSSSGPTILFQKSPSKKKVTASDKEWTWLLGAMVDESPTGDSLHMEARIEGPYITSIPGLSPTSDVIAIVGGTGITGALSLANWWISRQGTTSPTKQRLKIVWSVRDIKMTDIAEIHALQQRLRTGLSALVVFANHMSTFKHTARLTTLQVLFSIPELLLFFYIARVVVSGASIAFVVVLGAIVLAIILISPTITMINSIICGKLMLIANYPTLRSVSSTPQDVQSTLVILGEQMWVAGFAQKCQEPGFGLRAVCFCELYEGGAVPADA